jgi:hypothetical protein
VLISRVVILLFLLFTSTLWNSSFILFLIEGRERKATDAHLIFVQMTIAKHLPHLSCNETRKKNILNYRQKPIKGFQIIYQPRWLRKGEVSHSLHSFEYSNLSTS